MGCKKSKSLYDQKSAENESLEIYESRFRLRNHSIHEYEATIRRFQNLSLPSAKALEILSQNFSLPFSHKLLEIFTDKLNLNGALNTDYLISFAILYGEGSAYEKADSLWHIADTAYSNSLTKSDIQRIVKGVIRVSISIMLEAAIEENYFNVNRLTSWKSQLNERAEALEEKLLRHFFGEKHEIKKDEFINIVVEGKDSQITDPVSVRTLLEHTQAIPKKFANPFKNMKTKLTG
ncbi:unnamed protein product [Blepharisma stoltei]|uniref:Uncharacterized protein n=1 Tax=Blepharisma stoltei TaxID=1481888 RepID=A0AAU9J862_9CILI|nr:unnamed protein product [Blepharisma stoltei]